MKISRQSQIVFFTLLLFGCLFIEHHSAEAQKVKAGHSEDIHPPVVSKIGWWSADEQAAMQVEEFQVDSVEINEFAHAGDYFDTKGNYCPYFRVRIRISGRIKNYFGVKEVYVSERFSGEKTPGDSVDLLVVPIVEHKEGPKDQAHDSYFPFRLSVEYKLYFYQWDDNLYIFRCGNKKAELKSYISKL